MPIYLHQRAIAAICMLLFLAIGSASAQDARIGELTFIDRQWMSEQRELLEDLVTRHFAASTAMSTTTCNCCRHCSTDGWCATTRPANYRLWGLYWVTCWPPTSVCTG